MAVMLVVAALAANYRGLAQYITTGHVTTHWSFVVFGLFAVVQASLLGGFAVLDYLLKLFEEKSRAIAADLAPDDAGR